MSNRLNTRMNTRKRQIQEKIENFMAALAPDPKRFREVSAELQQGERAEIRKDLQGLPLSVALKLVRNLKKSGRLAESNDESNIDRQVELGRISPAHGEMMREKPNPKPTPRKPLTREEKKQIAAQRQAAIQASIDADNHSRAVAAGFPNWQAYMDSYRNDPRLAMFNRGKPEQTNEETLHELYGLAGLYARAIGNKRELSPEEQARGENPYLTPEGKTTYPTGPLAKILGAREYVNRARGSLIQRNRLKDQLYDDYLKLSGSVQSGRFKGVTTQDAVNQLLDPRMEQLSRILNKNIKRANRLSNVERANREALAKLPRLPDPNEPPHTYG